MSITFLLLGASNKTFEYILIKPNHHQNDNNMFLSK